MTIDPFPFSPVTHLPAEFRELPSRQIIQPPSHPVDDAIILSSGLAWLYHIGSGGQLRAVALRYAGEAIFPSELSMGLGVQTLTNSRVARCSGAAFRQLFSRSEHLLSEMISRQHRIALAWLMRSTLDTYGRLAHLFCELAARGGQTADLNHPFRLPFTQTELSSLTGQTTVNVNRVMRDWARSGLVAHEAPKLLSVDWAALRRIGRFDEAYLRHP